MDEDIEINLTVGDFDNQNWATFSDTRKCAIAVYLRKKISDVTWIQVTYTGASLTKDNVASVYKFDKKFDESDFYTAIMAAEKYAQEPNKVIVSLIMKRQYSYKIAA